MVNRLEKARRRARAQADILQKILLYHAGKWQDALAAGIVEPLLLQAAEGATDPDCITQAYRAAGVLLALPVDAVSEAIRARKELPETRRRLWQALILGVRKHGDTHPELGKSLMRSEVLSSNESKVLSECLKCEALGVQDVANLLAALRARPPVYNRLCLRTILQGIVRNGPVVVLEDLLKPQPETVAA